MITMPWGKKLENGKVCVYKKTTGKVLHCYDCTDTEDCPSADKYLAALHMHRPSGEKQLVIHKHCPGCGKATIRMKAAGVGGDFPGNMPKQMAAGLCKKFGGDPGFFTRCESSNLRLPDGYDKKAYCAELHKHCVGKWPTEGEHPKRKNKELSFILDPTVCAKILELNPGIAIWMPEPSKKEANIPARTRQDKKELKKVKGYTSDEIIIDDTYNDDWIRQLPSAESERKLFRYHGKRVGNKLVIKK